MDPMVLEKPEILKKKLADELHQKLKGELNSDEIDKIIESIPYNYESVQVKMYYAGLAFYVHFWSNFIEGNRQFQGDAGALIYVAGGFFTGSVYSTDLEKLFNETEKFSFTCEIGALQMFFYDLNGNYLGYFSGGGIGNFAPGWGTGTW